MQRYPYALMARFASEELATTQAELTKAIRRKQPQAMILIIMDRYDKLAVKARELDRIATLRLS